MAAKAVIEITCGNFTGYFYPSRFGPAGKSLCVKLDKSESSEWMTPVEFEKKAGKGAQHNWKRTVRSVTHENKTFSCISNFKTGVSIGLYVIDLTSHEIHDSEFCCHNMISNIG